MTLRSVYDLRFIKKSKNPFPGWSIESNQNQLIERNFGSLWSVLKSHQLITTVPPHRGASWRPRRNIFSWNEKAKRKLIDDRLKGRNHTTQKSSKTKKTIFVRLKAKKQRKMFSWSWMRKNKKREKKLVIDDVRMKLAEEAKARWAQQLDKRTPEKLLLDK